MKDLLIEDTSIIDKELISKLNSEIPFHWFPTTTSKKFPMYHHKLLSRSGSINSSYFPYFKFLVDAFCTKNNLEYKTVARACINSTFHIPNYLFRDPHVDQFSDHIVLLMYLNEVSLGSTTIIFDMQQDYNNPDRKSVYDLDEFDPKDFPIKQEITPNFGKIVAFDGRYYHSCRDPKPAENRVVCVFNLLI